MVRCGQLSVHWVEKEKLATLAVPPADLVIIEALTKDAQWSV
jgi:hypothetical protein